MAAWLTRADSDPYLLPQHVRLIDRKIVDVITGRNKRLMILLPPGHGKSTLTSLWTIIWALSHFPSWRVGLAAHTAEFAAEWGRKARNLINRFSSQLGISVASDSSAVSRWHIENADGGMVTVGVGGAITGRRLNLMVLDDVVKSAEEARSETYRERAWKWWQEDIQTRLEPNAGVIFIMTRRHHDDLVGRLLEAEGERWEVVKLPALAAGNEVDPLGRSEGEALWTERFPVEYFENLTISKHSWEALYQQNPTPESGNYFKREDWRYIRTAMLGKPLHVVQVVDTAIGIKKENDFTVIATWWVIPEGYFCRRIYRARMEFPDLVVALKGEYELAAQEEHRVSPMCVLVEEGASGKQSQQALQRETRLPIKIVTADKDKLSRAEQAIGLQQTHRLFLADGEPWVNDFVHEHAEFPRGKHDDQVDTTAHFANYIKEWEAMRGGDVITLDW